MTSKAKTKRSRDSAATFSFRTLDGLTKQLGHSFYIYDERAFIKNYRDLLSAFRTHYQHTNIAYSYKTNYLPQICGKVNELGGLAEIVSWLEYAVVRALGIDDSRVIFNGPCKDAATVEAVLLGRGLVNLDSLADLDLVSALARKYRNNNLRVGLRCSLRDSRLPASRFGLDVGGEEFRYAVSTIRSHRNVTLSGLHCHYPNRDLESFRVRTEALIEVCDSVFENVPDFLNLGGGFAGNMPKVLRSQFGYEIPTYAQYAQAVAGTVARRFPVTSGKQPLLFIEPGTGIVADCLKFVTRITATKMIRKKQIAVCGGSVFNTNPTAKGLTMPVHVVGRKRSGRGKTPRTDIVGYTCIESDYLARDSREHVAVGDFVVIDNVGSYSIVMKPPFILPNVPIVQRMPGKAGYKVIKRAEKAADIFRTFPSVSKSAD